MTFEIGSFSPVYLHAAFVVVIVFFLIAIPVCSDVSLWAAFTFPG